MSRVKNTRMCMCCHEHMDKNDLIKISKSNDVYKINFKGNSEGKSVYICRNCLPKVIEKKLLSKAFKCDVGNEIYIALKEYNEQTKGN